MLVKPTQAKGELSKRYKWMFHFIVPYCSIIFPLPGGHRHIEPPFYLVVPLTRATVRRRLNNESRIVTKLLSPLRLLLASPITEPTDGHANDGAERERWLNGYPQNSTGKRSKRKGTD